MGCSPVLTRWYPLFDLRQRLVRRRAKLFWISHLLGFLLQQCEETASAVVELW